MDDYPELIGFYRDAVVDGILQFAPLRPPIIFRNKIKRTLNEVKQREYL